MNVDINSLCPWSLSLSINGACYVVFEPTLRSLAATPAPAPDGSNFAAVCQQIDEMIIGPVKPDWESLGLGALIASFSVIEAYTKDYIAKKREAARAAARTTPGETTPATA